MLFLAIKVGSWEVGEPKLAGIVQCASKISAGCSCFLGLILTGGAAWSAMAAFNENGMARRPSRFEGGAAKQKA
jgi:hypothetical protein